MLTPTVPNIHTWSSLDFTSLDQPIDDTRLQVILDRAIDYVVNVTGRTIDGMPTNLEHTAQEAVQRRVEQLSYWQQEDYVETGSDDQVSNFSVGGYSETRHESGTRLTRGGSVGGYPLVNPWPALNSLLWLMMTDDQADHWREVLGGAIPPAFAVTEVDWGNHDSAFGLRGALPYDPYPPMTD